MNKTESRAKLRERVKRLLSLLALYREAVEPALRSDIPSPEHAIDLVRARVARAHEAESKEGAL